MIYIALAAPKQHHTWGLCMWLYSNIYTATLLLTYMFNIYSNITNITATLLLTYMFNIYSNIMHTSPADTSGEHRHPSAFSNYTTSRAGLDPSTECSGASHSNGNCGAFAACRSAAGVCLSLLYKRGARRRAQYTVSSAKELYNRKQGTVSRPVMSCRVGDTRANTRATVTALHSAATPATAPVAGPLHTPQATNIRLPHPGGPESMTLHCHCAGMWGKYACRGNMHASIKCASSVVGRCTSPTWAAGAPVHLPAQGAPDRTP